MTYRVAIVSQKGGVGKTTVGLHLAAALAERGLRTLLVDLDPQGGVGLSLARPEQSFRGVADVLMGRCSMEEARLETRLRGLSLLPRGRLSAVHAGDFEQALHRAGAVRDLLAAASAGFERVLIDTPAGLGLVPRAVLGAADFALVPFQVEPLALRSIGQVLAVIEHVRGQENRELELLGILPTMLDMADENAHAVLAEIWNGFEGVLQTAVPRSTAFVRASRRGLPLGFLGGPPSPEARRFDLLAEELEAAMAELRGKEEAHVGRPERALL